MLIDNFFVQFGVFLIRLIVAFAVVRAWVRVCVYILIPSSSFFLATGFWWTAGTNNTLFIFVCIYALLPISFCWVMPEIHDCRWSVDHWNRISVAAPPCRKRFGGPEMLRTKANSLRRRTKELEEDPIRTTLSSRRLRVEWLIEREACERVYTITGRLDLAWCVQRPDKTKHFSVFAMLRVGWEWRHKVFTS